MTDSAGQPLAIDPEAYTIEFRPDGTVDIKANCLEVIGSYVVSLPLDLTIDVAEPTGPPCGESSNDLMFLTSLEQVSSYSTDGGQLQLFRDGRTRLLFRADSPAGT